MLKFEKTIPGIHIQWPWSRKLLSGEKTVETRGYRIPQKYIGRHLAIIETAGKLGTREAGISKAQIVGIIVFSGCFKYESYTEWKNDFSRHRVPHDDPNFKFKSDSEKWGWVVDSVVELRQPLAAPKRRGIVFANNCKV